MTEWRRSWLILDLENILLINLWINSWLRILILLSISEEKQKIGICLLYKELNMSSNSRGRILFSSLWENRYLEAVLQLCLNRNKPLLIQELKEELEHFMAGERVYYFIPAWPQLALIMWTKCKILDWVQSSYCAKFLLGPKFLLLFHLFPCHSHVNCYFTYTFESCQPF